MIFPTILLVVAAFCVSIAEEKGCDLLNDTAQKINELHDFLLNAVPKSEDRTVYATCHLQPNPKLNATEMKVKGHIMFKQAYPYGDLEALFFMEGFPLDEDQSLRAIHIHEYGDLSNGCDSAGGHYNPLNVNHPKHPGDFGNLRVRGGKIQKSLTIPKATLIGQFSAIGKSVVLHKGVDDLGKGNNKASLENGNAGPRLACCVIGTTNKASWEKAMAENTKPKNAKQT